MATGILATVWYCGQPAKTPVAVRGGQRLLSLAVAGLLLMATGQVMAAHISSEPFGKLADGRQVERFTLSNDHGVSVKILTYGGVIQSLLVPDRKGQAADVVLGFNDLAGYTETSAQNNLYFGALIGRYANRIAYGRFQLDGRSYHVPVNLPPHTLHGGLAGFDKKLWTVVGQHQDSHAVQLSLQLKSPDQDQGFPGNLTATVTYGLDDDGNFSEHFSAVTDQDTIVSLTSHSFWNLDGEGSGSVESQRIRILADRYTPTDATGIPSGAMDPVAGTAYDFRQLQTIGTRLRDSSTQMMYDHGYDKNWVIRGAAGGQPRLAAQVYAPASGRQMDISTTQPGLQFYTSNGLDGRFVGKSGRSYRQTDAIALELEAMPDSPNHPQFPSVVLKPGQVYQQTTIFHFSAH